ncbi:hypothetical protein [Catellatospora sichuanensis]|uniref:hypothetical protein n=1 Tax=Catellatospora sichuanensis TaxID=1969805 RepID=UPI001183FF6D|nr:hypothetical protein [Catellatospora sichuanensis]
MIAFGATATSAIAATAVVHNTYAVGGLLAATYFTATPANAMLAGGAGSVRGSAVLLTFY